MPSKRGKISVPEALKIVLSGSETQSEEKQFPIIDLLIILDILRAFALSASLRYPELVERLRSEPDRKTLIRYLSILGDLGFFSKSKAAYRGGAVKSTVAFHITQRGRALVSVMNEQ